MKIKWFWFFIAETYEKHNWKKLFLSHLFWSFPLKSPFLGIFFLVCHFWHGQFQVEGSWFSVVTLSNFSIIFTISSGRFVVFFPTNDTSLLIGELAHLYSSSWLFFFFWWLLPSQISQYIGTINSVPYIDGWNWDRCFNFNLYSHQH